MVERDYGLECFDTLRRFTDDLDYLEVLEVMRGNRAVSDIMPSSLDSFSKKVFKGVIEKYQFLNRGEVLNHFAFKLSDLDMEFVRSVPPGGNWKNIPLSIARKSKRLYDITQKGGRTTFYGRLHYDRPSYTISTYFNRPGNGSSVHPSLDRVITVREAARLQAFPDDFYFWGNRTQLLKQVGNAVPSILAYQIAKSIKSRVDCQTSIDLFCGAGGMTLGFRGAGIQSKLCTDIEESMCVSLKINCPDLEVLKGDITDSDTKEHIIKVGRKHNVDLICGGPPCQGFSMAGLRLDDDPRNQLFKDFVDIVGKVRPKVVVFENVKGILSFQEGDTYCLILDMFRGMGYEAEGRTLMASEYSVPQKRERVIIICVRSDLHVSVSELFPRTTSVEESHYITVRDAISDLEPVSCENPIYTESENRSEYLKLMRGETTFGEYLEKVSSVSGKDTFGRVVKPKRKGKVSLMEMFR